MIQNWLGGMFGAAESPTADLYFGNAMAGRDPVVERLAPTVLLSATTALVIRHGGGLGPLPRRARTVYLIDDDVEAGLTDTTLPPLYRAKLRQLEVACQRRMLRSADLIVAGSETLARRLAGGPETRVLVPYWSEPFAALDHHADHDGPIDIAYLGSGVHRVDLRFLLPVVEAVLAAAPRARFHLSRRHHLPAPLAHHPRIMRIASGSWPVYRRGLAGRRFHIALYPLLDTPFNQTRSPNKLIEHAVVGAAPVYSASWPEAARVTDACHGLVRRTDPEAWFDAVMSLLTDHTARRRIAAGAQALGRRLNDPEPQRRLWHEVMA